MNLQFVRHLALIGAVIAAVAVGTSVSFAIDIPVGNHSFETEGTQQTPDWYSLPAGGDWTPVGTYDILDLSTENYHFEGDTAPDGTNVFNCGNATNGIFQDLDYTIRVGDQLTLSFYLGNSKELPVGDVDAASDPTVYFTLDGSEVYSEVVTNTAASGSFTTEPLSVQWTATSGGNLGIKFVDEAAGGESAWLDNVSVSVTPIPELTAVFLLGLASACLRRPRCVRRA